jgi:NHLM bacteriocin system ABC transporter peptidase/ATP-binding protein
MDTMTLSNWLEKLTARFAKREPGSVVRTPTVLQLEALECGAAALSIVLRHFGCYVSLEELRRRCGVSRDGSKATNVLKAARSYGLVAKGYKKEPADLREMKLPCIIFWNFNHFLVLEGFDEGHAYLNDPACGRRSVSHDEFDQSFTGVVLTMQPGPDFEQTGKPENLYRLAFKHLTTDRPALAFLMLAGLFMVLPGLAFPVLTSVFIDRVILDGDQTWATGILIGYGLATLLYVLLDWLQRWYLLRFQTKLVLLMATRFFWHLLKLPLTFFTQRAPGEVAWRLMLNDNIANVITGELARTVVNALLAVFFFIVMLGFDAVLALASLAVVIANLVILKQISQLTQESSLSMSIALGKLQGIAAGGLSVIETLRASAAESAAFARFGGALAQYITAHQRVENLGLKYRQLPAVLMLLNEALILCFGGYRVIEGHLTIGMLVAFQALSLSFIVPAMALAGMMTTVQNLRGDLQRVEDVLQYARDPLADGIPEFLDDDLREGPVKLAGHLEFCNVSFGYNPTDPPLLSDFSLLVRPGERIAIVGRSGCGKSTVAKLVAGLYMPTEGEILFDGKSREAYSRARLAGSVALVDQDITLFEGSFRENLTMWDPSVSDSELIAAAKDALIHDFVMSRPEGYDGLVIEGGRNMSGGQRQRLEIARALLTNPRLLVLDEATSALDTATEEALEHNLRRRGCSCIIIAHRLSTVRDCDRILVLDEGQLVEQGSHKELMALRSGLYRGLVEQG